MRKADNLPPSCAVVTKSGDLNFLEPSGPVQVCNGTALPLLSKNNPHTSGMVGLVSLLICFVEHNIILQMRGNYC